MTFLLQIGALVILTYNEKVVSKVQMKLNKWVGNDHILGRVENNLSKNVHWLVSSACIAVNDVVV